MLFTFPSRYWSTIGLSVVFSLAGWSPLFPAGFLVSCGTQVPPPSCSTVSVTGLSPSPAALPFAFSYRLAASSLAVLQPRAAHCYARGLGSSAFARHYSRNHCYFLFLRVLRCFSSPRSPSALSAVTASLPPGSPIRTSAVRAGICPSPPLFAACHVLLRLREPQASPMRPSLLSFFLFAFLPTLLRCSRCLFRLQCRSILQFDCSFSRISYINVKICLSIMSMTSP